MFWNNLLDASEHCCLLQTCLPMSCSIDTKVVSLVFHAIFFSCTPSPFPFSSTHLSKSMILSSKDANTNYLSILNLWTQMSCIQKQCYSIILSLMFGNCKVLLNWKKIVTFVLDLNCTFSSMHISKYKNIVNWISSTL